MISSARPSHTVRAVEQTTALFTGQVLDLNSLVLLPWDGQDPLNQRAVFRDLVRDMAEERMDGCEPGIAATSGIVSFAGDAVWDAAWYGFLGRYNRELEPDPGKVMAWNMVMVHPQQVFDVLAALGHPARGRDMHPLLITQNAPGEVFYAVWHSRDRRFSVKRRIGSLRSASPVGLSADGWIFNGRHWWRWEDGADSPPRFGNVPEAATSGTFEPGGSRFCVLIQRGDKAMACTFRPATARDSGQPTHQPVAFSPGGFVIHVGTTGRSVSYATSPSDGGIWRCDMDDRTWAPRG